MRTIPMPVIVAVLMLTAGVATGTAAATSDTAAVPGSGAGDVDAATVAPDPAANESTNESSDGYEPIEPPLNWTDKPVLETEIQSAPSTLGVQSQALTRQFLTSGPEGYRLMTFEQRAVGDHVEVWVARNLSWGEAGNRSTPEISDAQVEHIADEFDERIYPNETEIFGQPDARNGSEAQIGPPGYYNTTENAGNKTVLLIQNIRDQNFYDPTYPLYVAGYYSPTVQQYADRNVVTIDAYNWSSVEGEDPMAGYEDTLAHEYQHLIHADLDADETTWVNEGMSDFAEYAVGYGAPEGHLSAYEELPSNSLTNWEDQGEINVLADYGVAAAWTMYLDDRYGTDFISNLASEEKNGIAGVEATLAETGANEDFYGLYQDFSTAAVLDDNASERFNDQWDIAGTELAINTSTGVGTAGAWGTNYRTVDVSDKRPVKSVTLSGTNFTETEWSTATDPVTGNGTVIYSGSGNLLDRHAIVEADLSNATDPTLQFDSYQRIEENWDYGFVQVSTDGGETWQSLSNNNTNSSAAADAHPTVVENLPGFTGDTDGWQHNEFDLSAYAGEDDVLISFRYVTDWAAIQPGWYVKDVSIAGESVPTDTVEPYMSEREATGDAVEYQFTFIGFTEHGDRFRVQQLDARTFEDGGEETIRRFMHRGSFDRVVVASTWAAEQGESGRVPVGVEFNFSGDHDGEGPWGHPPWWADDDDGHDGPFDDGPYGDGPFDDGNESDDGPWGENPWDDGNESDGDGAGPPWADDDDDDEGDGDEGDDGGPPWAGDDDDEDDGDDGSWGGG